MGSGNVDCVGFEARGHGPDTAVEQPATVLNALMTITEGGALWGFPAFM